MKERAKMSASPINIAVPFDSLAESISRLDLREKLKILRMLDEQIAQAEEELYEQDPQISAEIRDARAAYKAGDFKRIDDYLKKS